MLDICYSFGLANDFIFNIKKSLSFTVGPSHNKTIDNMHLANTELEWISNVKYLTN